MECFVDEVRSPSITRMLSQNTKLVVISGPTAVGKSLVAVQVAEALKGEIIVADSRQIYRGMDIGTAKPGPDLLARVPHHLMDLVNPDEFFSAGRYREMAWQVIRRLSEEGKTPVVVGGTGLYIRVLLRGLWTGPGAQWDLRRHLLEEESRFGPGHLHRRLAQVDPGSASRIHPHDLTKTVRALEVALLTGIPMTQHHQRHRANPVEFDCPVIMVGLRRSRTDLYQRINQRVDEMVRLGLIQEVEHLLESGYEEDLPSMRGLGYRQSVGFLKGRWSLQEAVDRIKRDTRRYAKRQMTWFRKEPGMIWMDLAPQDGLEKVAGKILELCYNWDGSGDSDAKGKDRRHRRQRTV